MVIIVLVWTLVALCSLYAALMGGQSGRIGAALNVGATVATYLAKQSGPWTEIHTPVLIIDLVLLAALYALALRSKVYWPIWAAGFHLITVAVHGATLIAPEFRSSVYYYVTGMWAIFVQMAMVWGITLDRLYGPKGHLPPRSTTYP